MIRNAHRTHCTIQGGSRKTVIQRYNIANECFVVRYTLYMNLIFFLPEDTYLNHPVCVPRGQNVIHSVARVLVDRIQCKSK